MRRSGLILSGKFVIGILLWTTLLTTTEALRGSAVVLQAKTKAAEQKEADEENNGPAAGGATATNVTKPQLTGIPQIDYVLDPNLPRELNGHNLTDYPFYNALPEDIDFKCDGLHDGFYASVPHKCQVYHHCLYGTRFDFLCANYTAFDQKTFICHFVSEVDCDNSPKYFNRNEALYKEASTTTTSTTTTTTTTPSTTTAAQQAQPARHNGPRRRRPYRRRRPMYEYYYDDEEYAEPEYYDDEVSSQSHRRTPHRKHNNKDIYQSENRDTEGDYDTQHSSDQVKQVATIRPSLSGSNLSGSAAAIYERPRLPPKIRRPVPKNERDKYDYTKQSSSTAASTTTTTTTTTTSTTTTTEKPHPASSNGKGGSKQSPSDDEYYDDEEEYEYEEPRPVAKAKHHVDYDFPTGFEDTRRYVNRYRSRMPPARKRAEMYDDYDAKERPSRINRRKEYTRYDGDRPRNSRPMHRMKTSRHEEEPAQKYPAAKKRPAAEPEHRAAGSGRRAQEAKRPPVEDDYYYDEEEPAEEAPPKRGRRPQKPGEKSKSSTKQSHQSKERYQDEERSQPDAPANVKYVKDLVPTPRNGKANALENEVPKVSPAYNEIPTTESVSSSSKFTPSFPRYPTKTVKIVTNSLKDELDDAADTYSRSEPESRVSSTHTKPVSETPPSAAPAPSKFTNVVNLKTLSPQTAHRPESYSEMVRKEKRPFEHDDGTITATTSGSRFVNKTVIPVRHFVVSSAPRKPSHFLASLSTPVVNAYRDDSSAQHYRQEDSKSHHKQLPQQPPSGPSSKIPGLHADFYKPSTTPQNITHYAPVSFRNYAIPVVQNEQPKSNIRPVKEDHLVPETLNAINNGNFYHTTFITEPKSFANEASKPTSPSQQTYRQDHRAFGTNSDRFYTTNSISFPPHPPTNYDITAPGPSAPGEEPTAPEKKYPETSGYTSSADYDVTYNDALQPSTLHPVRRFPSTSFYAVHHQQQPQQQSNQQQQRSVASSRIPSDFNEGAYNSLSRSQSRYSK